MTHQPPAYSEYPNQQGAVTVITQQPTNTVILQTIQVGPNPTRMTCPNCLVTITTNVEYQISGRTHLCAFGLCLIGFWPCIVIPYCCCDGCCKSTVHYCPNCRTTIGSF